MFTPQSLICDLNSIALQITIKLTISQLYNVSCTDNVGEGKWVKHCVKQRMNERAQIDLCAQQTNRAGKLKMLSTLFLLQCSFLFHVFSFFFLFFSLKQIPLDVWASPPAGLAHNHIFVIIWEGEGGFFHLTCATFSLWYYLSGYKLIQQHW